MGEERGPQPGAPEAAEQKGRSVDLFPQGVLGRIAGSEAKPVWGGRTRRAGDSETPDTGLAERITGRISGWLAEQDGEQAVQKGRVAPRWRDVERSLGQEFKPAIPLLRQHNRAVSFLQQMWQGTLHGPPRSAPLPRGEQESRTPPGLPENLNIPSLAGEQAAAAQAQWGSPVSWLRTEVELVVGADGEVLSVRVVRSCGQWALDQVAVEAVRRAAAGHGPLEEAGPVTTRWAVESSIAVAPPTALGFAFDETGHLSPGATGIGKYLGMGTYPLKETVKTRVTLLSVRGPSG